MHAPAPTLEESEPVTAAAAAATAHSSEGGARAKPKSSSIFRSLYFEGRLDDSMTAVSNPSVY